MDSRKETPDITPALSNDGNDMGWTYTGPDVDEYLQDFIQFAGSLEDGFPVADVGCSIGHNAKHLLAAGTKSVIANDINEDYLKVFYNSLSNEQTERVVALRGNALTLNKVIKSGSLGGILAVNLLHFFHPNEVKNAFKLFFDLLKPSGKLYIATFSSKCGLTDGDLSDKRRTAGDEWPGLVTSGHQNHGNDQNASVYRLFLDPEDLEREAKQVGFEVEKCGVVARPDYPEWFCVDGQPGLSACLTAIKPNDI